MKSKKQIFFETAKICIPTSSGGHLTHMMLLKPYDYLGVQAYA